MKRSFLPILLFAFATTYSQNIEPLDLANKIFGKEPFPEMERYMAGEHKHYPSGQDIPMEVERSFLLLDQNEKTAAVAVNLSDSTGAEHDFYVYFIKDTVWKMETYRSLAMTGILEGALKEYESLTPEQIEEEIKNGKEGFESKEDVANTIGNIKLTIASDQKIIEHFLNNKQEFERIRTQLEREIKNTPEDHDERAAPVGEKLKKDYKKLFIRSISYGGYETCSECLNFLIGGMVDNSVGYLYVKDKKYLPGISSERIIMIREIEDGWYMYKTT